MQVLAATAPSGYSDATLLSSQKSTRSTFQYTFAGREFSTQSTEDTPRYLPTQTTVLPNCKGIFSISLSEFDLEASWPRKCEISQRSLHRVAFQSRTVL